MSDAVIPAEISLTPQQKELDRRYLEAAIRLGKSRIGQTAPNPSVGALIVRDGPDGPTIVGRGVTGNSGRPHGEVIALGQADNLAKGATCYVSLEPCSHHGKTPPCANALINAGISRVVLAAKDPDPRVSGEGIAMLQRAGISVTEMDVDVDVSIGHIGHFTRIQKARPAIRLKLAVSADEKIGRVGEGMVSITGKLSRKMVHGMRARADAIMVGIGTVLADNPELTCRLTGMEDWSPHRIVLDTQARLPLDCRLLETIDMAPVHVFVGNQACEEKVHTLEDKGAQVTRLNADNGSIEPEDVLRSLAKVGRTNLMIEGGATIATSFLKQNIIDRADIFRSSLVIGENGVPALSNDLTVAEALMQAGLELSEETFIGDDRLETWVRC